MQMLLDHNTLPLENSLISQFYKTWETSSLANNIQFSSAIQNQLAGVKPISIPQAKQPELGTHEDSSVRPQQISPHD